MLAIVLIATVVTVILVLPSTWYMLYLLFKSQHRRRPPITTNQYIESLMKRTEAEIDKVSAPNGSSHHHGVPSAIRSVVAVIAAVGIAVAASVVSHTWQRWRGEAHQRPESITPLPFVYIGLCAYAVVLMGDFDLHSVRYLKLALQPIETYPRVRYT